MGTFTVGCRIENIKIRNNFEVVKKVLVDTGSEYTWINETLLSRLGVSIEKKDITFIMANGQTITRDVGFAILRVDNYFTIDEVVFAKKGDLKLLGARTLEGLGLMVDNRRKKLVASGPLPAANSSIDIDPA
jgi:predicted aspartyl protease